MKEDEDEVLQEVPIYFTKNLANKLFIYQYPIELTDMKFDQTPIISSSVKPVNREVKLELKLNTESNNYDYDKGERIASEVNGAPSTDPKKPIEKYFRRNIMDSIKLESKHAVEDLSTHAVGVWHENEFHISPIASILHLRQSFSYLDHADKLAKATAKEQGLEDVSGDEDEDEVKQVTVKFARQENDRFEQARKRSYNYVSKMSADEQWIHTEFHDPTSSLAAKERQRLYANKKADAAVEVVTFEQRLQNMNIHGDGATANSVPSLHDLKKLPLVDQVRSLLKQAKIVSFERLAAKLGVEDRSQLLRAVQQVAVLVQGNWLVRSEVIYKKPEGLAKVPPTQVSPEILCRGRDYIMFLFTQKRFINRPKVAEIVKITPEIVLDILSPIAKLNKDKGWELLLPFDKSFVDKYLEVVQRQNLQWEIKHKQLKEAFKEGLGALSKSRRKSRESSISDGDAAGAESPRRKHRRKSQSFSLSSDNESGAEGGAKRNNKRAIKTEPKDS